MAKVLILANSSSGLYGFRNEVVVELLKKYEVYASLPDDTNNKELSEEGCHIIHTPINRRGVNPIEDFKLFRQYLRLLKEIKPDAVLSYTIKPNVYGGLACRIKHVPYLANITGLGSALENPGMLQRITKILYRIGLKKADTVFVQNSTNKEFVEKNKLTKAKITLIPGSGVNTERFGKLEWPQKPGFIYVSRVMKEKGIEQYLECAKVIREEYPESEFHILGYCEEGYEEELNRLAEAGVIIYHGSVKDVRPYLEKVRCIIHPSYYPEGMSNVCLEAASSGRAVITTERPGCRETVIDGKTGYMVPIQNTESVIEAVRKFLKLSSEEQQALGNAGREYVKEKFDRNIIVNEYLGRLEKIIE